MKKRAFTLAEILISMTIIGIVSMLMIPVIQNVQERSLEVATQHFHSMMSQAIKHYMVDNNINSLCETKMCVKPTSLGEFRDQSTLAYEEIDKFMYKYLNVSKVCTYADITDCLNNEIKSLDNKRATFQLSGKMGVSYRSGHFTNTNLFSKKFAKVYVLENGNVILLTPPTNVRPAQIQVDVNGKKKPNIAGRDIWTMFVYADGYVSEGLHRFIMKEEFRNDLEATKTKRKDYVTKSFDRCKKTQTFWQYGAGCFARFEDNGFKFDY